MAHATTIDSPTKTYANMRLIVAGSRHLQPTERYLDFHVALVKSHMPQRREVARLVCGMAPGVDTAALAWAIARGLPVDKYPADWKTHGRAAGPIRNRQMAENADVLLLIWDGKSRGSASMKAIAAELGLETHEVIA